MHFKQLAAAVKVVFGRKSASPVCVLGNPRTGGVRSCSLYSGIGLELKEKGSMYLTISGSRMARSTEATSKKEVEPAWLGLGLVPGCLGIGPLYSLPWFFLLRVLCLDLLVGLGNINSGCSLGLIPSPFWVPPRIGFRVALRTGSLILCR